MKKYGYYEVYVPVWNPNNDNRPVNLVIDIYGNEEMLDEMGIGETIRNYGNPEYDRTEQERIIQENLRELLRRDLVMDMMCSTFGINSIEDYEERMQGDSFDLFPL